MVVAAAVALVGLTGCSEDTGAGRAPAHEVSTSGDVATWQVWLHLSRLPRERLCTWASRVLAAPTA